MNTVNIATAVIGGYIAASISLWAGEDVAALVWVPGDRYVYRVQIIDQTCKGGSRISPGEVQTGWIYCDAESAEKELTPQLSWGCFQLRNASPLQGTMREENGYFQREIIYADGASKITQIRDLPVLILDVSPALFLPRLGLLPLPDNPEHNKSQTFKWANSAKTVSLSNNLQWEWKVMGKEEGQNDEPALIHLRMKAFSGVCQQDASNGVVPSAEISIDGDLWMTESGTLREWFALITESNQTDDKTVTTETLVSLTLELQTDHNFDLSYLPFNTSRR